MLVRSPIRRQGPYFNRIKSLFGSCIIGYWPLWEASGLTAYDQSGRGYDGSYSGPTLGQAGIGDGRTCPLFDGVNDVINLFSAGLSGAFNGAEGSFLIWIKMLDAATWTDGINRILLSFQVDANNYFYLQKDPVGDFFCARKAQGGGWTGTANQLINGYTGWMSVFLTWSEVVMQIKMCFQGVRVGSIVTCEGARTGSISSARIGGNGSNFHSGWMAHFMVLNRPATEAEIALAARV